jgi:O-antigen ligase
LARRAVLLLLLSSVVLTPLYIVKAPLGSISPDLLEVLVLAGLLATGALVASRQVQLQRWPLLWPALALVVAGTLALLWSPDRRFAFGVHRAYLVEPVAVAYSLNLLLKDSREIWAAAIAVVLGGLVVGGGEVGSAVAEFGQRAQFDIYPPTGFYENANQTALLVLPALCVALGLIPTADRRLRGFGISAAVILLAAFLLTYSRGGFLAALLAIALFFLLALRRRRWVATGAGVAVLLVGALALPKVGARVRHQLDLSDPQNSFVTRLPIWRAAVRMIRDHPFQGVGIAGFRDELRRYAPDVLQSHGHPHNVFLNMWLTLGLLGLLAFLWVGVTIGRATVQGLRLGHGWALYPLYCGLAAAFIAILVHGMIDNAIWSNDLALHFWTLAALSTAGLRLAPERSVDSALR